MAWLLRQTYRVQQNDPRELIAREKPWPIIAALWHNRIPLLVNFFPSRLCHQAAALASASRDGEYAAEFLKSFGYFPIRGSSSRGGYQALFEMKKVLEGGLSVALTVDGPRGPRYSVSPGAVILAEWTGIPIIPLGLNAPRRWELKGWDRTQIPKPFSRVEFIIGEPIFIAPDLVPEQRETECRRLASALMQITQD